MSASAPIQGRVTLARSTPSGVLAVDATGTGVADWIVAALDLSMTHQQMPQYRRRIVRSWGYETTPTVQWQVVTLAIGSVGLLEVVARSGEASDVAEASAWFETLADVVRHVPTVVVHVLARPEEPFDGSQLVLQVSQGGDRGLQIQRKAA